VQGPLNEFTILDWTRIVHGLFELNERLNPGQSIYGEGNSSISELNVTTNRGTSYVGL